MPLAGKCPSSQVLPRVDRILESGADVIGNALHLHLRHRNMFGVDEAMRRLELVAEEFGLTKDEEMMGIFLARARAFRWIPPRGSVAEKALCLLEDGSVVEVEGGQGNYPILPEGAILPSQLDLFWAEPEPLYRDKSGRIRCPPGSLLWAVDFKSGREENVDPAESNLQVLTGAVLAARFTGATRVMPAVIFLRAGDGIWDTPPRPIEGEAIDRSADLLTKVVRRVNLARDAYAEGRDADLPFSTGAHCRNCNCRADCHALMGQIRMFLDPGKPAREIALTGDDVRRLAELQQSIGRFADGVRSFLIDYVDANGPIQLAGGKIWGPQEGERTELDPLLTLEALTQEIGPEWAETALDRSVTVTKSSVEEAIAKAHASQGIVRRKAASMRMTMGRLKGMGGIIRKPTVKYCAHVAPPPPLEEQLQKSIDALNLKNLPMDEDVDG